VGVARLDSLALAIERFADDWPEALAVIDGARTWSWSDLHTLSHRYASELAGVRGTTDVVFLPAGGEALALLAACEVAGLRAILVAPPYSETRALAIRETFAARRVVAASGDSIRILAGADTPVAAEDAATPAILVLTSGTTGAPKCAVHTWSTLSAAVKERDSYAERRWMIAYPLSHFAALQVVAQCVFNRGTLVIPRDFGAPAALHALRDQGVEYLCATPTYMRQVLRASSQADWDAMALAHVTMGGEIVDQPLLDSLRARRPGLELTHTYASTELGAMVSVRDGRAGFDAALADGNDLAIRDGELFARRSHRSMVSYVGDDAAPADEWVATGDLVEIVDGRALFRGRTTDVINVGGYKVNPLAIEAVIREIEGVRDVLVIGRKSSITGHLIKAVVCGESTVDPAALQEAITRLCTERLPAYMVPRLFEFVDQLERTAAQKVARSSSS
jgi:acyl-coenzyme A synthetase/AMP-(fatty) acid ligase